MKNTIFHYLLLYDKEDIVVELEGISFNETIIEDEDYGEIASFISIKAGHVMNKLVNSELYSLIINDRHLYPPTHSSYIGQINLNQDYS